MLTKNRFGRAFVKKGALFLALFLILLAAIGIAFQGGNPQIQQGGTASFPRTGYDSPTEDNTLWDIVSPSGTTIATDSTPNGWNLAVVNDTLTVTAPTLASVGTNYEVRYSGEMEGSAFRNAKARFAARKLQMSLPHTVGGAMAKPGDKNAFIPNKAIKTHKSDIGINPASKSAYFDVVSANVAPSPPTYLSATAVASNRINLSWHDNSNNEGGFHIYREQSGGNWVPIATTNANVTSYSDIPLLPSTNYTYKVTAFNAYGESAPTNLASQTTFSSTVLPDGYAGDDFYVVLPDNFDEEITNHGGPMLKITSTDGATGLLTTVETGDQVPFTVPAGGSTMVPISGLRRLTQNDQTTLNSYRVTSDNAINIELLDYNVDASESWAVLPNSILGTEYVTTNYASSGGYGSQFSVVSTSDNNVVTIKPSVFCGSNRTAGVPFNITLQKGQTYQLKSIQGDLTGTIVTSTMPIGIVSGSQGSRVPSSVAAANPLEEQLLPFNRWQQEYVGIPFANHINARFRITAARKRTNVSVYFGDTNTTSTYTLNAGEFTEIETTSPIWATADKPIQMMQISNSQDSDYNANDPTKIGDPMMITMPSTYSPDLGRSNWLSNLNVPFASNDRFGLHYVTLISETHAMTTMYLNGNVINGWQGIGNTRFEYVRLALSPGNNVINGIYQGGAPGINYPAHFLAYGANFDLYDASGSIFGGQTLPNTYTNVVPPDPTNLVATTISAHEIDLSWTGSSFAYGYRIERSTDNVIWAQIADKSDGSTSYQDSGLHHKTQYFYRVTAYADVDSAHAALANNTTLNEVPSPPSGLNAVAQNDSQIQLTWTDNSDNENNFVLQRSQGDDQHFADLITLDANTTSYTDSNLTKKTRYYYQVKARNEVGDSAWSNESSDTTKDTKPTAPTLTVANGVSYNEIDLQWTDNSNNEDGFRIERQIPTGWLVVGYQNANLKTFQDKSGLSPQTTYTYRVVAYNNGGDSPSNSLSGTTLAPPVPNAPLNLKATAISDTEIQLNWTRNNTYESGFRIERSIDDMNWFFVNNVGAGLTTYIDPGLSQQTKYIYRVRAFNSSGWSAWSNEDSDTTFASPNPADVASPFVVATSSSSNTVYWYGIANVGKNNLYRATTSGGGYTLVNQNPITVHDSGPGVSNGYVFTDSGLSSGVTYYYVVKPVYSDGTTGNAGPESFDTPNPNAIPWNTNDGLQILAAVDANESFDWDTQEPVTVIAPNGVSYYRSGQFGNVQTFPSQANDNPANDDYTLGSDTFAYPAEPDPNIPAPGPSEQGFAPTTPPTGPFRRVESVAGCYSFHAFLALPGSGSVVIDRRTDSTSTLDSEDTAYIYTGGFLSPYYIDAGFARGSSTVPGWGPFIITGEPDPNNPGHTKHKTYYEATQTEHNRCFVQGFAWLSYVTPHAETDPKIITMSITARYQNGGHIGFYSPNKNGGWDQVSTCGKVQLVAAANRFSAKKSGSSKVKRLNSIAQTLHSNDHPNSPTANGPANGLFITGSHIDGCTWQNVQVQGSDFDSSLVGRVGRYPANNQYISLSVTNPWFNESVNWIRTGPNN